MANPAPRRIKSVIPNVCLELGGEELELRYSFAAMCEAGANPFDGSLDKLATGLTADVSAKFIFAGMNDKQRETWSVERVLPLLGPTTGLEVISAVAQQIGETAEKLGLSGGGGGGKNPPKA